jgi:hypothetical protein
LWLMRSMGSIAARICRQRSADNEEGGVLTAWYAVAAGSSIESTESSINTVSAEREILWLVASRVVSDALS